MKRSGGEARTGRRLLQAVVMSLALLTTSVAIGSAGADADGGSGHGSTDVTFTKWFVNGTGGMAGFVGGDAGSGAFVGQVLSADAASEPGYLLLHARYEFHGSRHTFVADVQVRENTSVSPPVATVDGVVTSGWKAGASVTGAFTAYTTCPVATPGNTRGSLCFQGRLHLRPGEAEASATFTKWVTSPTMAMAGVVGGAVGTGIYAGQVLGEDPAPAGFWFGHARYEFHGARHTFIADLHIVENDTVSPARATITGVVTSGWLSGARVFGRYTVIDSCPIVTPGNIFDSLCFMGVLHLEFGGGD